MQNFWGGFEKQAILKRMFGSLGRFASQAKSESHFIADKLHASAEKIHDASSKVHGIATDVKSVADKAKKISPKDLVVPILAGSALLGFGQHIGRRVASVGERRNNGGR